MAAVNPDRPAMAVAFSAIGGFGVGGVLVRNPLSSISQPYSYAMLSYCHIIRDPGMA